MEIVQDNSSASTRPRSGLREKPQAADASTPTFFQKQHPTTFRRFDGRDISSMMDLSVTSLSLDTHGEMLVWYQERQDARQDGPQPIAANNFVGENEGGGDEMMMEDESNGCQYTGCAHSFTTKRSQDSDGGGLADFAGIVLSPRKRPSPHYHTTPYLMQHNRAVDRGVEGTNAYSSALSTVDVALSVVEERVSLAPRFSQDFQRHYHPSSSPSFRVTSEATTNPNSNEPLEPASPTSTTVRDFLREVPCPSIPIQANGSNCSTSGSSVLLSGSRSFSMDQSDSSSLVRQQHTSHLFLQLTSGNRQHQQDDRTNSVSTTTSTSSIGRALCRSFAWSHDSQDELRITKRQRTLTNLPVSFEQQHHSGHNEMFPLPQQRQQTQDHHNIIQTSSSHFGEDEDEHRDDPTFSPTLVHWEETVIDCEELLERAARHDEQKKQQTEQQQQQQRLGFVARHELPPLIASAASASQYSFDSGP